MAQTFKKLTINGGGVNDTFIAPQIAEDFSTSKTYSAGNYCTYQGVVYKFTAAKTAGAWDAAKVTAVNVADDVGDLKSALTSKLELKAEQASTVPSGTDYDTILTEGNYRVQSSSNAGTMANCPVTSAHRLIVMSVGQAHRIKQFVIPSTGEGDIYERYYNGTSWRSWVRLATENDLSTFLYRNAAPADIDHLVTPGWYRMDSSVTYTTLPDGYSGSTGLLIVYFPSTNTTYAVQELIGPGGVMYFSYVTATDGRSNTGWVKIASEGFATDLAESVVNGLLATTRNVMTPDIFISNGVNLFNAKSAAIQIGKSIGTGAIQDSASGAVSHPMYVKAGIEYKWTTSHGLFGSNAAKYLFLKPDGTVKSYGKGSETSSAPYTATYTPTEDGIILFHFKASDIGTIMFGPSSTWPEAYVPCDTGLIYGGDGDNVLYGKKIACDGASIMAGNESYQGGYAKMIAINNNMTITNNAVGGGTIANGTYREGGAARHWICESIQNLPSGYDYYIFDGASNDHGVGVQFGTPSAVTDYSPTLDLSTFAGAFESCCMALQFSFVTGKKGYIIPHRKYTASWWTDTWKPFIIATLEKWGIPYLDLEEIEPPIGIVSALKSAYTVNGDGTHPTEECYRLFYVDVVTAWLKTL